MTPATYMGMRLVEDASLRDFVGLDWSNCRSPARAMRRHKRGPRYKQRVVEVWEPKPDVFVIQNSMIVGHPATLQRIIAEVQKASIGFPPGGSSSFSADKIVNVNGP